MCINCHILKLCIKLFINKIWGKNHCVQRPCDRVENGVPFICVLEILDYLFQFNDFNS